MSDELFQGDSNADEKKYQADSLDLFSLSSKYKKFWTLPDHSPIHTAITLLIFRGVSWDVGAKIMERIRIAIGKKDITLQNFTIKDAKLKEWGLSGEKISGIRKILSLPEVTPSTLCKVKEGGIYLVKAFKIISEEDDDVFLSNDYNIQKCLGILFFRDKLMSKTEAMSVSRNWAGYRSRISYFLYRLKPEGAFKILEDEDLEPWDFWGKNSPIALTETIPIIDS